MEDGKEEQKKYHRMHLFIIYSSQQKATPIFYPMLCLCLEVFMVFLASKFKRIQVGF